MSPSWRSLMFVPADDAARLAKAGTRGADALILDLEDAVPPSRKALARVNLFHAIPELSRQGANLVIRINAGWREALADLDAAVRPGVAAIMVPKVENAARLIAIGELIAELAAGNGVSATPGILALVESPAGVANLKAIAAAPGVIGIALGSEDFSLALGAPPVPASLDLPCRLVALAAAQFGLMALGLPISIATIEDIGAWEGGVAAARAVGMTGALCIHPKQVGPANMCFAPSEAEVMAARRLLEAWEARDGAGVISFEGKMVDRPLVLAAQRTIERGSAIS